MSSCNTGCTVEDMAITTVLILLGVCVGESMKQTHCKDLGCHSAEGIYQQLTGEALSPVSLVS